MRTLIVVTALSLFACRATAEDAYFFRIEDSGYDEAVDKDKVPEAHVLNSIETLVRPGGRFSVRAQTEKGATEIEGLIKAAPKGAFWLEVGREPMNWFGHAFNREALMFKLEERIAEARGALNHQRGVSKDTDNDPAVQSLTAQLSGLQKAAEQLQLQIALVAPNKMSIGLKVELGKPTVVSSCSAEILLNDGKWRKFRRVTTVMLRGQDTTGEKNPFGDEPAARAGATRARWPIPPEIDRGMLFDSFERQGRPLEERWNAGTMNSPGDVIEYRLEGDFDSIKQELPPELRDK